MPLVDTHSHIHDADFGDDADEAIARARAGGVEIIVTLGVNRTNSELAVRFAEQRDIVVAAAGVHPHDAKDATEADLDALEEFAADDNVAMVGEIGLDLYRNLSPLDAQLRVLRRQLATAARVSKPVSVHSRDAHHELLPLLTRWSRDSGGELPDGRPLGVMHYFSEDADLAARYIALGFLISIHTSVTHPKAIQLVDVVSAIPLDHLVIETDSPYGAPQRYRGRRNEPAYVTEAAAKIAEIKGEPLGRVAEATTANAMRLLGVRVPAGAEKR